MPSTHQSVTVDASITDVWDRLKNFHDMSWSPNVISNVTKVGDVDGTEVGARRILNGAFHETLIEIDDNAYSFKYSIDDGPSPVSKHDVSNYVGTVKLSTVDNNTLVEWSSSWDSNSEDAVEFCHGIYVAVLGELNSSFQ